MFEKLQTEAVGIASNTTAYSLDVSCNLKLQINYEKTIFVHSQCFLYY